MDNKTQPQAQLNASAADFLKAFAAGKVCLHPTDTLPGLTFDPRQPEARAVLMTLKGRPDDKAYLGLVGSAARALVFWEKLPEPWGKILPLLWPGPLSVIWQASPMTPPLMRGGDGTIGLRVPSWPSQDFDWFQSVLEALPVPLPTTSVNRSGDAPISNWQEAAHFLTGHTSTYVPASSAANAAASSPSTLIKLAADGSFMVLRQGAMPLERLRSIYETFRS